MIPPQVLRPVSKSPQHALCTLAEGLPKANGNSMSTSPAGHDASQWTSSHIPRSSVGLHQLGVKG